MTERERHERACVFARAEAGKLLERFGLHGWHITWVFVQADMIECRQESGNDIGVWATVIPDTHRHEITITLATLRPLAAIRQTLKHELAHVLLEPLWRFVQRMIWRAPKAAQAVLRAELQEILEQTVSDVTRAVR